jgi:Zn-dependent protease with chaperone function
MHPLNLENLIDPINPERLLYPIDPLLIKNVRHKAEMPLFAIYAILNVLIVIGAIFFNLDLSSISESMNNEFLVVMAIIAPFLLGVLLAYQYAQTRGYSIKVSEYNFPEIFYKSVEYSKRLGLKKLPAVYVEQQNGILNAFAAAVLGKKRYISINAELVDIAYMEHRDFDPIFFILAHEFGHVYFRHVAFKNNMFIFLTGLIPFFNSTLSRAREYSCDRIAQLLLGRDGIREMMVLTVGRHLYKYVNIQDYILNAGREKGLLLWIVNFLTSHPVTTKRVAALADPEMKSGKLFW